MEKVCVVGLGTVGMPTDVHIRKRASKSVDMTSSRNFTDLSYLLDGAIATDELYQKILEDASW